MFCKLYFSGREINRTDLTQMRSTPPPSRGRRTREETAACRRQLPALVSPGPTSWESHSLLRRPSSQGPPPTSSAWQYPPPKTLAEPSREQLAERKRRPSLATWKCGRCTLF